MPVIIHQNPEIAYRFTQADFDVSRWASDAQAVPLAGGRGASYRIPIDGRHYVLRRYLRGGLMASLLQDRYLWTGLTHSRPFREQRVLERALDQHLPVPKVAAYQLQRRGLFYRAAIISTYIPNRGTLASWIAEEELPVQQWQALGALIRRLHQAGIDHADLNANNILIDDSMGFHLIDFDKARLRSSGAGWAKGNLQRLLRSLLKIQAQRLSQKLDFHFHDEHWQQLLQGYR